MKVKVVSLVMPSLLLVPVSVVMPVTVGVLGAVVSIITAKLLEVALVFPAASELVAVIL